MYSFILVPRLVHLGKRAQTRVASVSLFVLTACNLVTGASGLTAEGDPQGSGGGPVGEGAAGASTARGGGGASNTGGSGGGASGAGSASGGAGGDIQPSSLSDAQDIAITEVAVYQTVKVTVMKEGTEVAPSVPVVANKDLLVRVFVAPQDGFSSSSVVARLFIGENPTPDEVEQVVSAASTDASLASTFNFTVPAAALATGLSYRVELLQESEAPNPDNPLARFPGNDAAAVPLTETGTLKIMIVPIKYGADGSNRLPDTSSSTLESLRKGILSMYPVSDVELQMHAALSTNVTLDRSGDGWSDLHNELTELRFYEDNVPDDLYYFGLVQPTATLSDYLQGGSGIAGFGFVNVTNDPDQRAALGLSFATNMKAMLETMAHELGHNHGRKHSPGCISSSVDPSYPNAEGNTDSWGYNAVSKVLSPPDDFDFMGYCDPSWISSYSYEGLLERVQTVNGISSPLVIQPSVRDGSHTRTPTRLRSMPPTGVRIGCATISAN